MIVAYVAGPLSAKTLFDRTENIEAAKSVSRQLVRMGVFPICPHANSGYMSGAQPESFFIEGDLRLLDSADVVVLCEGWETSLGTLAEIEKAKLKGTPVFDGPWALWSWMRRQENVPTR
jgi:hypothetical protein